MNGFPLFFLKLFEPYLNDKDLSSVARVCKPHMLLSYLRGSKLVFNKGWEQLLSSHIHLSNDPFVAMQAAKLYLISTFCKNNYESRTVGCVSFDFYMQYVCFQKHIPKPMFDCKMTNKCWAVYHWPTRFEKCVMAIKCNNFKAYSAHRTGHANDEYFLKEAISLCESEYYNVSILLHELSLQKAQNDTKRLIIDDCVNKNLFYAFEHVEIAKIVCKDTTLIGFLFHHLLCQTTNGVQRANRLMGILKIDSFFVFECLKAHPDSLICKNFTMIDSGCPLKNYLAFEPTRDIMTGRVHLYKQFNPHTRTKIKIIS